MAPGDTVGGSNLYVSGISKEKVIRVYLGMATNIKRVILIY